MNLDGYLLMRLSILIPSSFCYLYSYIMAVVAEPPNTIASSRQALPPWRQFHFDLHTVPLDLPTEARETVDRSYPACGYMELLFLC